MKSPKSFDAAGDKFAWGSWEGVEAMGGFEASFGPASKNPPPLSGGEVT